MPRNPVSQGRASGRSVAYGSRRTGPCGDFWRTIFLATPGGAGAGQAGHGLPKGVVRRPAVKKIRIAPITGQAQIPDRARSRKCRQTKAE